jgi:hypothetical protein
MKITRVICSSALLLMTVTVSAQRASQLSKGHIERTKVVLLGTGTPVPDPDRSGPATAIVVDDSVYLVDFGPGVVRRAKAAVLYRHITALEPANLKVAFATHLQITRPVILISSRQDGRLAGARRSKCMVRQDYKP